MAQVVVTLKIMPSGPDADLTGIESKAKEKITSFSESKDIRAEQKPVAFGLKELNLTFVMDESKGSTDPLEEDLKTIEGVNSAEAVDVRRAIG